jgi:hypothetical protein
MSQDIWAVFRQDFTGNEFLVEKNLSKDRADELVIEYESHKHHQHYWACELPETDIDYTQMLRESLESGSSLNASLVVLKHQNASASECIEAVQLVRGMDLKESTQVVMTSPAFATQN